MTITNPDGQSRTSARGLCSRSERAGPGPPSPRSRRPRATPPAANPVTLTGTDFVSGASITIGGVAATGVDVTGPTAASATTAGARRRARSTTSRSSTRTRRARRSLPAGSPISSTCRRRTSSTPTSRSIFRNGITAGCGGGSYCRDDCGHARADGGLPAEVQARLRPRAARVPGTSSRTSPARRLFADWIEELYALGVTGGCRRARSRTARTPRSRARRWRRSC